MLPAWSKEIDARSDQPFGGRKARFRIVWVRVSESEQKIQAAVHKLEKEE
jgi:hypothetical protein